jgi:hypothetical protein
MTFGAPETEALYEGSAQKGFGVSTLDGSPMPLGLKATHEPIEIPRSLWGGGNPRWPQDQKPCGSRSKATQTEENQ